MTNELEVLYSSATREVEVACTSDLLVRFSQAVIAGSGEFGAQTIPQPEPYSECLRGIRILPDDSTKVIVSIDSTDRFLQISGTRQYLEILGLNLRDLGTEGDYDEHFHIDYFPGHYYLDESSLSVVVRLMR